MEIIKIECNGTRFEFVCNSRGTKHGFAHDCNLFINDNREQTAHCHYLNRTWECWRYQTACITALNQEIEWYTNRMMEQWKGEHGYNRMTKTRRVEFDQYLNGLEYIQTLTACKDKIKNDGRGF